MLDAQLQAEGRSINRRGAIRRDVAQRPHVPDTLERWLASLWAGRRPGVGHTRIVAQRAASNREGFARRTTRAGTLTGRPWPGVRPPVTHSATMVPSYFLLTQTQKPRGVVVEDIALLRWR